MSASDFEVWKGTFLRMAQAEGWQFKAQGRDVDPVEVFSGNGFAPGILAVAQRELDVRGFQVDLDLYLDSDDGAGPLGVSVSFGDGGAETSGNLGRQYWRFATTSFVLDSLLAMNGPSHERLIALDPLFAVFKPSNALVHDEG